MLWPGMERTYSLPAALPRNIISFVSRHNLIELLFLSVLLYEIQEIENYH